MAMNIGSGSASGEPDVMSEMNTTPLIDVMLVLLIMLILTIPVQLHSVNLNLPTGTPPPPVASPPPVVRIDIDVGGVFFWNGEKLADRAALEARLQDVHKQPVQPEVHIRGDKETRFENIGRILADLQRSAILKVGFITNPEPKVF